MISLRCPTRKTLTAEQVEDLVVLVGPWWRRFVLVLAYCGLQPGEAVALRRRHLDDLGRVTIEGVRLLPLGRRSPVRGLEEMIFESTADVSTMPATVLTAWIVELECSFPGPYSAA